MMKHRINPLIDCVFKRLMGTAENLDLLASFLNALLAPPNPIVSLTLVDTHVKKQTRKDDTTIVDVLATDSAGYVYQVEVQLTRHTWLLERMLYCWADIYQEQIQAGQDFDVLRPVISIWILDRPVFRGHGPWHRRFQVRDDHEGALLSPHLDIHTVELNKWRPPSEAPLVALDRWMYFFKEARAWTSLPEVLDSPEMRKAMSVIERWSEKESDYRAYRRRLHALRVSRIQEKERVQLREEKSQLLEETGLLRGEKAALQGEKAALQGEKAALQGEKAALQGEKAALQGENQQLHTELEALRAELARLRAAGA